MSLFADVDAAGARRTAVLEFLDMAAAAETGIKHYVAAAHAARAPDRPILDIGCGGGHDLELFAAMGMRCVGIDSSATVLAAAAQRSNLVVRASSETLPFPAAAFAGARIERVLLHVREPAGVLAEAARCVRPGGLLTVFEPDFTALRVRGTAFDERAGWLSSTRHPDVGEHLAPLVEAAGFTVLDRIEERSVWRDLARLERSIGMGASIDDMIDRAVEAGRIDRASSRRWVDEQRARDARGEFFAELPKILVVAQRETAT